MAAQGKSTGLQVGLIIAVVVALIASVAAFILYRGDQQNQARYAAIEREKQNVSSAAEEARSQLEQVKQMVGAGTGEVGNANDLAPGTVLGTLDAQIKTLSTGGGESSLLEVAKNLSAQLKADRIKMGEQALEIAQLNRRINQLDSQYGERQQQFSDVAAKANADLSDVQAGADERVESEQKIRRQAQDELAVARAELEEEKERLGNQISALRDERDDLIRTNERLTLKIEATDTRSFTSPDGSVVRTESTTNTVYVNLGESDKLRPGVTFSVYDKDEVGPNGGDISALKGSIEIINVGRRLSEARVLDFEYDNPISQGDPIFSPVWSPGQAGQFAFVGLVDLDGDNNTTGERDRLRRILDDAGSEFSIYVDDEGNWIDGDGNPEVNQSLDPRTEMLVLGDLPDEAQIADPEKRAAAAKIRAAYKELQSQARRNGIPTKSLKVFLETIGYVPTRRRYVPGEDADFNLKRGTETRRATPNPGSTTSGLFAPDRDRRRRTQQELPSNRFRAGSTNDD